MFLDVESHWVSKYLMTEVNDEPTNTERTTIAASSHNSASLQNKKRECAVWCTSASEEKEKARERTMCLYFAQWLVLLLLSSSLNQLTFDLCCHSCNPVPSPVLQLWWGHRNDESNRATNGAVWPTSLLISMTASLPAAPSFSFSCWCYGNRPMQCYRADRVKCQHLGGFECDRQKEQVVEKKLQPRTT